jgi:prepilin-type N-terminal cleavage/methylation domain-containing protein
MQTKRIAQRGFTLVEMAVVLVVIGLILGAVTIGRDVQRNAEYTKVKQKFIDQWVLAYNAHVQRTGVVPGDSQTVPRLMVDGANYNTAAAAGATVSGGNMTAATPPPAICQGAAAPGMARAIEPTAGFTLRGLMQAAGVRMPPGRAEGQEDRYVYLDTNGNPQEIQVCFQWNRPGTGSNAGNVMVISGLTPDLARALDQMVDGKADAQKGIFRQEAVAVGTAGAPGLEWSRTNQNGVTDTAAAGANRDEDQIATVIAHYKMNQ